MTPAPFTNGADLQTDWFFDYFTDHHHGQYVLGRDMKMLFHGGDNDLCYEASIDFGSNKAYIRLVAGDILDIEFIGGILQELLGDIHEHPESVIDYIIDFETINKIVTIYFFYKDTE